MLAALRNAGIHHLRFSTFLGPADRETLLSQIDSVDHIITSPGRKQELVNLTRKDIIEFIFSPDQASIDLLKTTLMELKQKNLKKWE
jgi:GntR family transcriptional regulator